MTNLALASGNQSLLHPQAAVELGRLENFRAPDLLRQRRPQVPLVLWTCNNTYRRVFHKGEDGFGKPEPYTPAHTLYACAITAPCVATSVLDELRRTPCRPYQFCRMEVRLGYIGPLLDKALDGEPSFLLTGWRRNAFFVEDEVRPGRWFGNNRLWLVTLRLACCGPVWLAHIAAHDFGLDSDRYDLLPGDRLFVPGELRL